MTDARAARTAKNVKILTLRGLLIRARPYVWAPYNYQDPIPREVARSLRNDIDAALGIHDTGEGASTSADAEAGAPETPGVPSPKNDLTDVLEKAMTHGIGVSRVGYDEEFPPLTDEEVERAVGYMMFPVPLGEAVPVPWGLIRFQDVRLFRRKEDSFEDVLQYGMRVNAKGHRDGTDPEDYSKCIVIDDDPELFQILPAAYLRGKVRWAYRECVGAILRRREERQKDQRQAERAGLAPREADAVRLAPKIQRALEDRLGIPAVEQDAKKDEGERLLKLAPEVPSIVPDDPLSSEVVRAHDRCDDLYRGMRVFDARFDNLEEVTAALERRLDDLAQIRDKQQGSDD